MTAPTPAQVKARDRNWRIYRLRAVWAQACLLTPRNRTIAQAAIDDDLRALNAETETDRQARARAKYEKDAECPIPF